MTENTQNHRRLKRQEKESKLIKVNSKILPDELGSDDYLYWMPVAIDNELLAIYGKEQGWDKEYNKPIKEDYRSIKEFAEFVKNKIALSIQISKAQIIEEMKIIKIEDIFKQYKFIQYNIEELPDELVEEQKDSFKRQSLYALIAGQCCDREAHNTIRSLKFRYKHLVDIPNDELKDYYYNEW